MKKIIPVPNITSIYIHWPFCNKICNYCNFNKYAVNKVEDNLVNQMGHCLIQEGKYLLNKVNPTKIHTIYFGGGTPSLMKPKVIHVSIVLFLMSKPRLLKVIKLIFNKNLLIFLGCY